MKISPAGEIATRILPRSLRCAVSALGRLTSMPASLTKDVVTMKKINMMNTMSSMGVMLISAPSSRGLCLRAMNRPS